MSSNVAFGKARVTGLAVGHTDQKAIRVYYDSSFRAWGHPVERSRDKEVHTCLIWRHAYPGGLVYT